MSEEKQKSPEPESVRLAMDQAWREHQHSRDQTWKALQIMIALVAGLVAVEVRFHNAAATVVTAVLVVAESLAGLFVAKHHRNYQIRKFTHIMQCEEWLGLRHPQIISDVTVPSPIVWSDVVRLDKHSTNTVLFIMRMHLGFILFALLFAIASVVL